MVKCPQCKGKKKLQCTINEIGKKEKSIELTCPTCNGRGKVSSVMAAAFAAHRADWCHCDDTGNNIQYYSDGSHPKCHKHHYRHEPGCGKIVQIG